MTEPDPPEDDFDILAAEYVLGLQGGKTLPEGAAFNRAVQEWTARLLPLTGELAAVEPRPQVWSGIAAALRAAPRPAPAGFWNSLAFWRYFGLAGGFGMAVLAAVLVVVLVRPAPLPNAVATLTTGSDGVFVATAHATGGGMQLVVSPSEARVPDGKSVELWLLNPGAKPRPLGLLASNHVVIVTLAGDTLAGGLGAAALAISLEPEGGSPTGAVTGPVLASARFTPL